MFNFFNGIWDFIVQGWNFFLNFLSMLRMLLNVILSTSAISTQVMTQVPYFLAASGVAVYAIACIKLILGRDNS